MEAAGRFIKCFLICAVILLPQALLAHKIRIFAAREGDKIKGSCYFSGGKGVENAVIAVYMQGQEEKLSGVKTDENGEFEFSPKKNGDYKFIFDSGDGHKTETTVSFRNGASLPSEGSEKVLKETSALQTKTDAEDLRGTVAEEMSRQLFPLRKEVESLKDTMRFRDILGGIGFILGFAGIAAYCTSKKNR